MSEININEKTHQNPELSESGNREKIEYPFTEVNAPAAISIEDGTVQLDGVDAELHEIEPAVPKEEKKKPKAATRSVSVSFPVEVLDEVNRAAYTRFMKRSAFINWAVYKALKEINAVSDKYSGPTREWKE